MERALPKGAGANFTWDSVQLNLRSVGKGVGGEEREFLGEGQHRNLRKRGSENRAICIKGRGEVRDLEMMGRSEKQRELLPPDTF